MAANYMIAGGGTGGHIFPAVAIGEAIAAKVEDADILFVGTRYGMENKLIPKLGYPLLTLPIRGFLGKSTWQRLALLWRLPASILMSFWLLLRYRPKVVIGVGGYASAPLLWSAALLGFPTMIQEQNAFPGLTNRLSAKLAKLACLGFAEAKKHLSCPVIITGNPVRAGFKREKVWTPDRRIILILGGSQGARALNETIPRHLSAVLEAETGLEVIHQCGAHHVEAVEAAYARVAFPVTVTPFIEKLHELMNSVRLVICRAGASTISELKLAQIPAVLVPFPRATHDHQTFNARDLADRGAAWLLPEDELPGAGPRLGELLDDEARLAAMARAYPSVNRNSAEWCAEIALALQARRKVPEIIKEYA